MYRSFAFAALVLTAAPALAQQPDAAASETLARPTDAQAETGRPPERVRSVTISGTQACPKSTANEVVVCSRINPDEQYRIPKAMRDTAEVPAARASWVNRAAAMDQVSRVAGGLPDTCSPIGTGGQSGCALAANRAYAAERRAAERNDALVPGGGD
jgi:hypothetical protein